MNLKKLFALLLAAVMVFALAACGQPASQPTAAPATDAPATDAPTPTEPPVETRPNRVVFGTTTEVSGDLGNAWWSNNATDKDIRDLINDYGTIVYDQGGAMVQNATTCAGVEQTENEDGSITFTVKIKEGLVYNNGEPITAADYVANPLVAYSPATKEAGATVAATTVVGAKDYQDGTVNYLSGVRLIDDYTYAITIVPEYAQYYYAMSYASLSPLYLPMYCSADVTVKDDGEGAYLDGGELKADEVNASRYIYADRVSAGPYQIESIDTGTTTATLVINPNYNGNFEGVKPQIETLVFVRAMQETQFDMFKTGEIDILSDLGSGDEINTGLDLVQQGGIAYTTYNRAGYGKLMFQCDFGPTQFIEVRHAIAYLLDREEFANTFTGGFGSVVDGPYGLAMWMYEESEELFAEKLDSYSYNPEKAVEVLEAGGWTLNADGTEYSGEGVRYKDVTDVENNEYFANVTLADGRVLMPLHIMWSSSDGNPVSELLVTMLANGEQTAAAGVEIEQNVMTFSELLNYMYRDSSVDEKYGVPTYGMYNLASGFTPVYDFSFNWSSDPYYVDMGYNTNYLFDDGDGGLDDLSMKMVYDVAPGDDAAYLDYWQQYIIRWNELLPEVPLYSNIYHTFYYDWLKDYVTGPYWGFPEAIVYAYIENAE